MPEAQPRFSESAERQWILLLCCLAAIHVFIFSAAFPFFNNVDEFLHFDLLVKYSHGHLPRRLEHVSPESADFLSIYSSSTAEFLQDKQFPSPPQTSSGGKTSFNFSVNMSALQHEQNYESSQPP